MTADWDRVVPQPSIAAASLAQFPREACGFVLATGTVVVAENLAEDGRFHIDPITADRWWPTGQVVAVWHSHCFDPAVPSQQDEELAHPDIECWIYSVPDEQLGIYRPDEHGRLQLIRMEDI